MKIWFDGQCLQTASRFRGIGRYAQELIRALSRRPGVELSISFNAAMPNSALAAREAVSAWIPSRNIHMWESAHDEGEAFVGLTPGRRLGQIAQAHHVAMLSPDIAVSTSPFEGHGDGAMPLEPDPLLGLPLASIFYDAIPHRFPERYLTAPGLRASYERRLALLKSYDLNLCISAYSTREVAEIAGGGDNVDIGAGVSPDFLKLLDAAPAPVPEGAYALYVGGLDWRKNVAAVIEAFARLAPHLRASTRFVVAGDHPAELLKELRERWSALGLREDALLVQSHVSDLELVSLYRGAAVAVQPSYLEGFGLTALEAMICGAPVLAAARGAAPEVVQDPGLMFEPDDHARFAALIARMIEDRPFRDEAVAKGFERAKAFTWENSAAIAHAALERVAAAFPRVDVPLADRRLAALARQRRAVPEAPSEEIVDVFARAEPAPVGPGRFFVDCTALIIHDGGTGIQRVTRQISGRLAKSDDAVILFSDDETPFRRVEPQEGHLARPTPDPAAPALAPRADDLFLMLDSSWDFHKPHLRQLLPARLRGARVVSTLYDLVPLMTPAYCVEFMPRTFMGWLRSALVYSTGFVCISRAVAEQLHGLLEAIAYPRTMRIGHWPLGADFRVEAAPAPARAAGGRARFLMVGTIEPRKGYDVALAAFERLWAAGEEVELTIVGKPGWNTRELMARMNAHPQAGTRLHLLQGVSDERLAQIYADADALISASHAEGFGLPLVEARHFGKPAIVSDLSVFREVTEGARDALFFRPGDPGELARTIGRFLAGARAPTPASAWPDWDESARRLMRVIREDGWQMTYRPKEERPFVSPHDIGETRMRRLLGPNERAHRVELISTQAQGKGGLTLRLRVTNLSGRLWSSNHEDGGRLGFALAAQGLTAQGAKIGPLLSASLPFVLPAGWDATLAIDVPDAGAIASIVFEAGQNDMDGAFLSWGEGLRAPTP